MALVRKILHSCDFVKSREKTGLRRFYLRVGLVFITLFFVSAGVVFTALRFHKQSLAEAYIESARSNLLGRNYKRAQKQLQSAIEKDFLNLKYHSKEKQVFELYAPHINRLRHKVLLPVSLSTLSREDLSGALTFEYGLDEAFRILSFSWLVFLIVNIPMLVYLGRRQRKALKMIERERSLMELGRLSRQVAHDIRSPLSLLSVLSKKMDHIDPLHKELLAKVIQRLNGVAEEVLSVGQAQESFTNFDYEEVDLSNIRRLEDFRKFDSQYFDLNQLIREVLQEKTELNCTPSKIDFEEKLSPGRIGVYLPKQKLARVLSNLINNSIESVEGQIGRVRIQSKKTEDSAMIQILDSGKGIPKNILGRVGEEQFSWGKPGGNGLGLSHAKNLIHNWHGSIEIKSQEKVGTLIEIRLPRAQSPPNHQTELQP